MTFTIPTIYKPFREGSNIEFPGMVVAGNILHHSVIQKFGRNDAVGTSYVPVCSGGNYQMPTSATALRVKAGGNAADAAGGNGARLLQLQGLDANGNVIMEELATAGASASSYTTNEFLRLFRIKIIESGTYATQTADSHAADIVIEDSSANEWGRIEYADSLGRGQSTIGCYSIPAGYTGYLTDYSFSVTSGKATDIVVLQRTGFTTTSAPYPALREFLEWNGDVNHMHEHFEYPLKFDELTDIVTLAKVDVGTAAISVHFNIVLVKNGI